MAPSKIRSVPTQDPIVEPTKQNVSYHYTYTGGNLTRVEKSVNGVVFARDYTWSLDGNLTDISEWVEV